MGDMFKKNGTLNIPISEHIPVPRHKIDNKGGKLLIFEAYCCVGHSLISGVKIDGYQGIHFIHTDQSGERESEIVVSSFVGDSTRVVLSGEPFKEGEAVRILCPVCRRELPILFDCECGADIYLFFINKDLKSTYGLSFCSRIGCMQASRMRFSCDMIKEYMGKYCF